MRTPHAKKNPHRSVKYIKKSFAKHYIEGVLDYEKFYNEINYISPGVHIRAHYSECLDLLEDGNSWLDAGCGCGHYIKQAIHDKNIRLFGMDVVDKSVAIAIKNGISCIKHSISELFPYDDETFDLVTSTDVLEHLCPQDVDVALSEIYRVLKFDCHAMLAPHTKPDRTGVLHLTTKPKQWWVNQCEKAGFTFVRYFPRTAKSTGYHKKGILLNKRCSPLHL